MATGKIMRTKAREVVFEVIFASRFSDGIDCNLKNVLYKKENLSKDDVVYADRVFNLISEHEKEFEKLIDNISMSFPQSRLYPADFSVLLIALAEIKFMDDIPVAVSINEAANIASKYSSAKSASFISGILAAVTKE